MTAISLNFRHAVSRELELQQRRQQELHVTGSKSFRHTHKHTHTEWGTVGAATRFPERTTTRRQTEKAIELRGN